MCNNHSPEHLVEDQIKVTDISSVLKDMPDGIGFIRPDEHKGILPQFAKKISAIYLLMHWPFINDFTNKTINPDLNISRSGFSMYAALVEHGKKYVAEVFIANEEDQCYQGTVKIYSIDFPNNIYDEGYDDWLMSELSKRVTGVTKVTSFSKELGL